MSISSVQTFDDRVPHQAQLLGYESVQDYVNALIAEDLETSRPPEPLSETEREAIEAALADYEAGDRGVPAEVFFDELWSRRFGGRPAANEAVEESAPETA